MMMLVLLMMMMMMVMLRMMLMLLMMMMMIMAMRWHRASRPWGLQPTNAFQCHVRESPKASQSLAAVQEKSRGRLWGLQRTAGPRDKWQDVSWLHADTEMEWGHSTPLLKDIEVEHCCDNLPPQSHATSERLGAQCFNHGTATFYWTLQLLPGLGPVWCPEEEGLHKANQQSGNELHAVGIH